MKLDTPQIDAIVQAVLLQLQTQFDAARSAGNVSANTSMSSERSDERVFGATPSSMVPATSALSSTLRVTERLVTSERLSGRLKGVQCLQVDTRAVVTPLVRDLLRQSGIRLERVSLATQTASRADATAKYWLYVQDDTLVAHKLARSASVAGPWQVAPSMDEWLRETQANSGGQRVRAAFVTRRWAEQMSSLSQQSNVRVVTVESKEAVREAQEQIDPQRFVVNSSRLNESQVAQVLQEIANLVWT